MRFFRKWFSSCSTTAPTLLLAIFLSRAAWAQESMIVQAGIDTTLAQEGLSGPDYPHGPSHPEGALWEFDLEDPLGGGANHGLIWFDIPSSVLARLAGGTAILRLYVANSGDEGRLHRVTADWLSGPGDDVTWNNMPGGPGIVLGRNALSKPSAVFPVSVGLQGSVVPLDVSADVQAWAEGVPNYGWAFLPTGTNGTEFSSFESEVASRPTLEIQRGEGSKLLQPGDADQDLDFDQLDLVQVLIAGRYRSDAPATWGEGDWNGAPGGRRGDPPLGDGRFDQLDVIIALSHGLYLTGSYAAGASSSESLRSHVDSFGFAAHALAAMSPSLKPDDMSIIRSSTLRTDIGEVELADAAIPEPSSKTLIQCGILILIANMSVTRRSLCNPQSAIRNPQSTIRNPQSL